MALARQTTLKSPIVFDGIGLHSGAAVSMQLLPAPDNHGIVFELLDDQGVAHRVPARWDHVVDTRQCTVIGTDAVSVGTIEHVMAALVGSGVDNACVRVTGGELPAADGSSVPFVNAIQRTGLRRLSAPRRHLRVQRAVSFSLGGHQVRFEPCDHLELDVAIDFDAEAIGQQRLRLRITPDVFRRQLASARTFGFHNQVEAMRAAGLGRGGSLENCVVITDQGDSVMNPEGLRFDDEFVRHKMLDALGDLALLGAPLRGRYIADRPSHHVNHLATRALLADRGAWMWDDASTVPTDQGRFADFQSVTA